MTASSTSIRSLLLTGVAALLAVGCGGAVGPGERTHDGDGAHRPSAPSASPEPSASAPSGPNAAQLSEPCPVHPDEVLAGQSQDMRVRPGATRARVCLHPLDLATRPGPVPVARTAQGAQATDLAARYAGLAPLGLGPDQGCNDDLGPTATVLFGYADDSAVAVATELFGCGASRFGPYSRTPLVDPSRDGLTQVLLDIDAGRTQATTLP